MRICTLAIEMIASLSTYVILGDLSILGSEWQYLLSSGPHKISVVSFTINMLFDSWPLLISHHEFETLFLKAL